MYKGNHRGFTLLELLVVTSTIALLTSVVLAATSSARVQAQEVKKKAEVRTVNTALTLFNSNTSKVPSNHLTSGGVFSSAPVSFSDAGVAHESQDTNSQNGQAYNLSMQELVDAKVLPYIPKSPDGFSYSYINTNDTLDGAIFAAVLKDGSSFQGNGITVPPPPPQAPSTPITFFMIGMSVDPVGGDMISPYYVIGQAGSLNISCSNFSSPCSLNPDAINVGDSVTLTADAPIFDQIFTWSSPTGTCSGHDLACIFIASPFTVVEASYSN